MTAGSHAAGTVLDAKFRIVRPLGVGGMGAVYEIEHELTKHRRALKLLHAEVRELPGVVERFLREASAAGRIGDPHIVETFDAGSLSTGEPYVVMEMLEGETLGARLERRGRLDLGELCDLVGQACDGVQAAHDAGIVHRDLKPENLFVVTRAGAPFVKILDFGVSKFDAQLTGGMAVTKEGSAIGTPLYMPPEQVRGARDLDARADVYALGVILYECASGQPPFEATSLPHLALLIHEGKSTPLGSLRPDLPPEFVALVQRAMHVDRDARVASARELGSALRNIGSSNARAYDATALEQVILPPPGASPPAATGPAPPVSTMSTMSTGAGLGTTTSAVASTRPTMGEARDTRVEARPRRGLFAMVAALVALGGASAWMWAAHGHASGVESAGVTDGHADVPRSPSGSASEPTVSPASPSAAPTSVDSARTARPLPVSATPTAAAASAAVSAPGVPPQGSVNPRRKVPLATENPFR